MADAAFPAACADIVMSARGYDCGEGKTVVRFDLEVGGCAG